MVLVRATRRRRGFLGRSSLRRSAAGVVDSRGLVGCHMGRC